MRVPKSRLALQLVALVLAGPAFLRGVQDDTWPPPVTPDAEGAPVLSAEESMKTIVLPPGYHAELVAKEPLVEDPILLDFDADGRMWVVEMPAFAVPDDMQDSREPLCRVVVLEDVDDDGAMDRRTVFADGLILPRAIKTLDRGVLVGEPPNLWLMRDGDGDLNVDEKELVSDTFGRRDGNPEHNANSLIWSLDNWLFTSEHDWHLRFHDGAFEVVPTLPRGQWGGSIDDAGRVYRNVNNGPLFVDITTARYFMRNPNAIRTRGLYEPLVTLEEAVAWPVRPTRGVNRGYRDQFFRPDGSSRILQSAATPVVFRGDGLPEELRGGVFVTDSTTNLVHWFVVEEDETGRLTARNGFERGEIFASRDERLRPVSAFSAPDGTLYVVDMYRGVVQDGAYQTAYLQDYIRRHGLVKPTGCGRVWRIVHDTTVRDRRPGLSRETAAGLVGYLSHPNGWWRDTAQQLLVQRGDASVAPALEELARGAADWRTRLHALGALAGLGCLEPAILEPLFAHESAHVRAWAIRWSEEWLARPHAPLAEAVLRLMDDPSWIVRRQLAASIGALPKPARLAPSVAVLERYGGDPLSVDAVVSGLAGLEEEALDRLLGGSAPPQRADAVAMLAGAITRSGHVPAVQRVLDRATAPDQPPWLRVALLQGVELGLGGGVSRGGPWRTATRESLSLPEAPTALVGLEDDPGEVGAQAHRVLARLDWPGRPPPVVEVAPLTAHERARFEQGRKLYQNLCIGCHQADGRGGALAPGLVGSPRVVGPVGIPTRIVLGGMEGEAGLMPPLSTLSDAEIASVLTYVRREWGHTGSPVQPEDVREIRGLTALRKRPWTSEDLSAIRRP
jgi:mono/diheme cytochrome c family protein/glucose/arabinose dehydrogenase